MLTIGRRDASDEPGELLRACHERIRRHLDFAARLAGDAPASADDLRATAGAVRRYFAEALPLHERDEDDSIAPLLPHLADAVATMHAEHLALHPHLAALIAACDAIAAAPEPSAAREAGRAGLAATLAALGPLFAAHLAAEEAAILPAVDALPAPTRAALRAAMRARRA